MAALDSLSPARVRRRPTRPELDVELRRIIETVAEEKHRARRGYARFSLMLALAVAALLLVATMGIAGATHTLAFGGLGAISAETGTWLGVAAPDGPAPRGSLTPGVSALLLAACAIAIWSTFAAAAVRHPRISDQ